MPGAENIIWVDPSGETYPLMDIPNIGMLFGRQGAYMPPVQHIEGAAPNGVGTILRGVNVGARDIDIPLRLKAADSDELYVKLRTLNSFFNPLNGSGKLRVTTPDGVQRELYCRYLQGLQGNESKENRGPVWTRFVLTLRAHDSLWYDVDPIVRTFGLGTAPLFFPLLPIALAPDNIIASASDILNQGDDNAWPIWTIDGPGDNIELENVTTGQIISLTNSGGLVLAAGEQIVIDTRRGQKWIKRPDGTRLMQYMSATSDFWPIRKGSQSIEVRMSSLTAASKVTLVYYQGYLTL